MKAWDNAEIKPSGEIERSKKELKFKYSTAAYDSYAIEGFDLVWDARKVLWEG